jgi:hypothetical protein
LTIIHQWRYFLVFMCIRKEHFMALRFAIINFFRENWKKFLFHLSMNLSPAVPCNPFLFSESNRDQGKIWVEITICCPGLFFQQLFHQFLFYCNWFMLHIRYAKKIGTIITGIGFFRLLSRPEARWSELIIVQYARA